jgi:hypothetical protein
MLVHVEIAPGDSTSILEHLRKSRALPDFQIDAEVVAAIRARSERVGEFVSANTSQLHFMTAIADLDETLHRAPLNRILPRLYTVGFL